MVRKAKTKSYFGGNRGFRQNRFPKILKKKKIHLFFIVKVLFEYIKTKTFNPETKPTNDIAIETIKYDKKHKLILFVIIPLKLKA